MLPPFYTEKVSVMDTCIFSRQVCSLLLGSALLVVLVGCGTGANPVTGKVTFEGKPLAGGGGIQFIPLEGEGKPSGGVINEDGTYSLSTFGENDGAMAGKHRVEILQNEVLQAAEYTESEAPAEDGKEAEGSEKQIKEEVLIADEDRIPELYSGPQSTLTATVEAGSNTIDFDLKRTP